MTIREAVSAICAENEKLREFWCDAHGWAPRDAANLLAKSRLDRQVALSKCLKLWIAPMCKDDSEGRLIMAWINLGSLLEGTMKFFLSVYLLDYRQQPVQKYGKPCDPDVLTLEELRQFYVRAKIWDSADLNKWDSWSHRVQQRRNAVHAFKHRDIGTHAELLQDVRTYGEFLKVISNQIPYPTDQN